MRRQIAIQFVASNSVVLANLVLTIVLARLLTPEDIGVFSMAAVLVATLVSVRTSSARRS
jgi:O-antigen/teichoic acid export membrane protein